MEELPKSPYDSASYFSKFLFLWPYEFIKQGLKGNIEAKDLAPIAVDDDVTKLNKEFYIEWNKELKKKNPSLLLAVLRIIVKTNWWNGIIIVSESVARIYQAVLLGMFIKYLIEPKTSYPTDLYHNGFIIALLIVAIGFVINVLHHHFFFHSYRLGLHLKLTMTSIIYDKTVKLHLRSINKISTGHIVNLCSQDVESFLQTGTYLHFLYQPLLESIGVIYVGVQQIGYSFLAGFALILLLVPLQSIFSRQLSLSRTATAGYTDQRLKLVNQALTGVRLMKINGWENTFVQIIETVRKLEISALLKTNYLRAINEAIFFSSTVLVGGCTFLVFVLTGGELSVEVVMTVLTLYNISQFSMTKFFPYSVQFITETLVSIKRIQHLLLLEENILFNNHHSDINVKNEILYENKSGKVEKDDMNNTSSSNNNALISTRIPFSITTPTTTNTTTTYYNNNNNNNNNNSNNNNTTVESSRPIETPVSLHNREFYNINMTEQESKLLDNMDNNSIGNTVVPTGNSNEEDRGVGSIYLHRIVSSWLDPDDIVLSLDTSQAVHTLPSMYPLPEFESSISTNQVSSMNTTKKLSLRESIEHSIKLTETSMSQLIPADNQAHTDHDHDQDLDTHDNIEKRMLSKNKSVIRHASTIFKSGIFTLFNIHIKVKSGEFLMVVGPVGSSKSSLLMAILGELPILFGDVVFGKTISAAETSSTCSTSIAGSTQRSPRIAYCAQEPWILSTTVRENILFGKPYDPKFYNEVIAVCSMTHDLSLLPHGDETVIGDRGVNLSGGQKARIGLARAIYSQADIYLLDDPLSAVDSRVGNELFHKAICTYLQHKTRILVTHQIQFLSSSAVDRIAVMNEGHMITCCTYQELSKNRAMDWLQGMCTTKKAEDDTEEDDDDDDDDDDDEGDDESEVGEMNTNKDDMNKRQQPEPEPESEQVEQKESLEYKEIHHVELEIGSNIQNEYISEVNNTTVRDAPMPLQEDGITEMNSTTTTTMEVTTANTSIDHYDGTDKNTNIVVIIPKLSTNTVLEASTLTSPKGTSRKATSRKGTSGKSMKEDLSFAINSHSSHDVKSKSKHGLNDEENGINNSENIAVINGITSAEDRQMGVVQWSTYLHYFQCMGGIFNVVIMVFLLLAGQGLTVGASIWLAKWSRMPYSQQQRMVNIDTYIILVVMSVVLSVIRSLVSFDYLIRAAETIQNMMLRSVVRAPLLFFDSNPLGRILNRFSRDIGVIDDNLPMTLFDFLQCLFMVLSAIAVIAAGVPFILVALIPLVYYFYDLRKKYIISSREVKRLDALLKSPIYSHLNESIDGLVTIRAYQRSADFVNTFRDHINHSTRAFFCFIGISRWLGFWLDIVILGLLAASGFIAAGAKEGNIGINPTVLAVGLMYVIQLCGLFQWMIRQSAEVENMMVAVERTNAFSKLQSEPPLHGPYDLSTRPNWPEKGHIELNKLSCAYRVDLPPVINHITIQMLAGERIGIVGRTGSGKSTLISALLRMVDITSGHILIDGIDISTVGLHDLRPKISVIPQVPFLFSGTIRKNLDIFDNFTDLQIWNALDTVGMKTVIENLPGKGDLSGVVEENGSNFSVGERQLLCLARAILQKNAILIMDEATANIDMETDSKVQYTVREQFHQSTVIMIAHRLQTVIDCDKILVLRNGSVVEYDHPHVLLEKYKTTESKETNKENYIHSFASMVEQTGESMSTFLHQQAALAYEKKQQYYVNITTNVTNSTT